MDLSKNTSVLSTPLDLTNNTKIIDTQPKPAMKAVPAAAPAKAPAAAPTTSSSNSSGVNALLSQLGGAMKKAGDKPDGAKAAPATTAAAPAKTDPTLTLA
tara:strand:- start:49 stop:348 length:300 start_codon:yes stop_codon:yes gene_type:complete